jgi:thiamine-phosphate pyrophosphorylase
MALVADAAAGLRAARAGATLVQLRNAGLTVADLEQEAEVLVATCPVPVLVSGRVDVAMACGAAGVHLPEDGLPVTAARRLLPRALLGRSVHSLEAALEAEAEHADYVVFGPVYPTPSHLGRPALGLEALRRVASATSIPVLAIGGVDRARLAECLHAGAGGAAAIRMFLPHP